ncbi:MAG: protein-glutamate O-methyltransferase CheR [Clostridium sp.]
MDYTEFTKWACRDLKIDLTAYKEEQLERRLKGLLTRKKLNNYAELKRLLTIDLNERKGFLEFITINVTEFFRNPELFMEFKDVVKNDLSKNNRGLKIWSAACSNGSEPYTIGMLLKEISPNSKHDILATDIDPAILAKAKSGEYTELEVKNVDNSYKSKYFVKEDNKCKVKTSITSMVRFKQHDLISDTYESNLDIIVCRNVVIYFKNETKDKIFDKFSKSLKSGGLLFIGATESIYNYKAFGFEKVTTFIYRKI